MLSNTQVETFQRDGYVIFDPGIPPHTIQAASAALKDLYLAEDVPPETDGRVVAFRDSRRIQDGWKVIPEVKEIALAPRVLQVLGQLYGRKPLPFQTLNFRVGSEQKTHSDTVHFNSKPSGFMCGVWVALEDIDRENGPVVYYPGSHKWDEVALPQVDEFEVDGPVAKMVAKAKGRATLLRDVDVDYPKYERVIQQRIDAGGIAPAYATIKKGQAFIWAANLLHGGSPQLDRSRTRASQVTHYFFEGCRYYTPLLQRGWRTAWRTPAWIT
jgi:ectoine hydroxylase-related dioxygenase (phytanoyl-CoA dioxygenase family)